MSVSPELHAWVLKRDGGICFLARTDLHVPGALSHVCMDKWGNTHASNAMNKMTVDHVNWEPGGIKGKRAPDDEAHLVTMCAGANISGPARWIRAAERDYLRWLYDNEQPI